MMIQQANIETKNRQTDRQTDSWQLAAGSLAAWLPGRLADDEI